jgi:hypothetical protein
MKGREHNDQTFEDTKGLIRRHKSMKDREHNGHKFEDTKGVIRRPSLCTLNVKKKWKAA